jgi:hypothetical protein
VETTLGGWRRVMAAPPLAGDGPPAGDGAGAGAGSRRDPIAFVVHVQGPDCSIFHV